jgi:hypothetical protein
MKPAPPVISTLSLNLSASVVVSRLATPVFFFNHIYRRASPRKHTVHRTAVMARAAGVPAKDPFPAAPRGTMAESEQPDEHDHAPEDEPGAIGAEGGSETARRSKAPLMPDDHDDSPLGDSDQHSSG